MYRMDLNAVNPRVHAQLCRFGEGVHHLFYFLYGKGTGNTAFVPAVRRSAGAGGQVIGVEHRLHHGAERLVMKRLYKNIGHGERPAEARSQLDKHFTSGLVELVHKIL